MMPLSTRPKCNHEGTKTRRRSFFLRGSFRAAQPEPRSVVPPGLDLFAPVAMVDVPARRGEQALLQRVTRHPSQLAADLRGVDGVPAIVARTIRHERFQVAV